MNPELRRNLWLEISTHRLLGMPAVIALALLATAAIDTSQVADRASWFALGGYVAICLVWGTRLAANSVIDEVTEKTWDWQRLSSMQPWLMTWGKLFGSTVFAWYGGLLCLLVFILSAPVDRFESPLRVVGGMIFVGIFMHAAAIAAALHTSRQANPNRNRWLGLLVVLVTINFGSLLIANGSGNRRALSWYGFNFEFGSFALASAAVFAGWSVIGAYRAMCQSLMVRTTPVVWLLFLIFLTAYCGGFMWHTTWPTDTPVPMLAVIGLGLGLVFTYLMLFTELTGPLDLRRIAWKWKAREWRRAFEEMPCWPVAWLYAAVCALLLAGTGMQGGSGVWRSVASAPMAFALLAARDAGILLFFLAAPKAKRAVGTAVIYIVLLSSIIPAVFGAMGMSQLAHLLLPIGGDNAGLSLLGAATQAAIALLLAGRRIHRSFTAQSW
jgi:hypothetical protein